MAKTRQNWVAFVLELIGSLVFLAVFFGQTGALNTTMGGIFGGQGAFWLPVFYGAAVIASVALFFASFGNLTGMSGPRLSLLGIGDAAVASICLAALTFSSSTSSVAGTMGLWATVVGFALSFLGSAAGARS